MDKDVYAKTSNNLHANNAKPYRRPNYNTYGYKSYQPNYMH